MSQKHKKRATRGGGDSRRQLDTPQLEQSARAECEARRWRDAIATYKELLKRESRPDWRQGLSDAYAGRARELTDKGMLKEALAIWENRAALGAPPHPAHSALLARLGRPESLIALLNQAHANALPREQLDGLRALLAAQVLSGNQPLLKQLAEEDPVRTHAEAALNAMQAYCEHDEARLNAALDAIPFRSPYRDWVRLLKALVRLEQAPGEAKAQLERISDDSPFASLKRAAQLSLSCESAFLQAANAASSAEASAEFQVACALRGWPVERIALWREFARLGDNPAPKVLMRQLYQHVKTLGADWVRRKALNLAVQGGHQGPQWLRACGAPASDPWEKALFNAWHAEQLEDPWEMAQAWQNCVTLLNSSTYRNTPNRHQRVALMLRRTEAVSRLLERLSPQAPIDEIEDMLAGQLETSLEWDVLDRPTYLLLIKFYRYAKKLKEARRVLEQAQRHWPRDIALLEAAMDVALDAGSFKKAAGLARQILDIDPINTGVRERLISAHFSHARKQVKRGRLDLAHKELGAASDWAKTAEARAQMTLAGQLLDLIAHPEEAATGLRERFANAESGLDRRMELMLATAVLGLRPSDVNRLLSLKKPKPQGREDLLAALTRLRGHLDTQAELGRDLVETLGTVFNTAPWKVLSRAELETACDTLARSHQHRAREQAATLALKRWPNEPLFVLHRFEAKYPDGFRGRPHEVRELQQAMEQARDQGDTRMMMRLQKLLPFMGLPFGEALMDFEDEDYKEDNDELLPHPEADFIIDLIDSKGVIEALKVLDAPKDVVESIREIRQQMGEPAARLLLKSIITGAAPNLDDLDSLPLPFLDPEGDGDPAPKRGRGRKSRRRK